MPLVRKVYYISDAFSGFEFPQRKAVKEEFLVQRFQFHEFPDKFPTNIGCDAYFVVFFSRISSLCY